MKVLLTIFLKFLSLLPFRFQMFLGGIIGRFLFVVLKKRRSVAKCNLQKCFPHFSEKEIHKISKKNFMRLGQAIFEITNSYYQSDKKFKKKIKNISEFKSKIANIKNSKNLLLIPHTSNIDFVARLPSLFIEVNGMQKSAKNKLWDEVMTEGRKKFVKDLFLPNEARKLLKALNKGEAVLYAPDQDYGKNSIFVDFFKHKAFTVIFPSTLVKRTKCKVFLLTAAKTNDGYLADLLELNLKGENTEDDLSAINSAIEDFAIKNISEYFWIHRRFKNRPEGERNFYPDEALREKWL